MIPGSQRPLCLALAGLLAAGAAQAVNVSPDGRGQVLLYPYYTTRTDSNGNAYATLLSVINANGSAKAVRVRFLEGRNSRAVVDFNLFLSPFDVWTAAVLPDPATGGARIGTADLSCTLPAFSASPTAPYVPFTNAAYAGANDDGAGTGLDRTKEGYFEIIEMATFAASSLTSVSVTHANGTANGVPRCRPSAPPFEGPVNDAQAALDAQPPSGGLFGSLTLINVNSGTDYTADAVALANFYRGGSNYRSAGAALPDLTQATPPQSAVWAADGTLYESLWTAGTADAVSAALMHDSLINEVVQGAVALESTDWVVTFPTKRHYVKTGSGNAPRLFQRNFNGATGSCDDLQLDMWDREERHASLPGGGTFGGLLPYPGVLCWGANVATFISGSRVLGSTNGMYAHVPFQPDSIPAPLVGWMNMSFLPSTGDAATVHRLINDGATTIGGGGRSTTTGNTVTYAGLPAIGFAVTSFTNGTLQVGTPPVNTLSNYGGNFVHKTNTTIQ